MVNSENRGFSNHLLLECQMLRSQLLLLHQASRTLSVSRVGRYQNIILGEPGLAPDIAAASSSSINCCPRSPYSESQVQYPFTGTQSFQSAFQSPDLKHVQPVITRQLRRMSNIKSKKVESKRRQRSVTPYLLDQDFGGSCFLWQPYLLLPNPLPRSRSYQLPVILFHPSPPSGLELVMAFCCCQFLGTSQTQASFLNRSGHNLFTKLFSV